MEFARFDEHISHRCCHKASARGSEGRFERVTCAAECGVSGEDSLDIKTATSLDPFELSTTIEKSQTT